MSWREKSAEVIRRVIDENKGVDEKTLRKALHDAYPFHERKYHPYKIWLDEIKVQLGAKPPAHKRAAIAAKLKKVGTSNPRLDFEWAEAAKGKLAL